MRWLPLLLILTACAVSPDPDVRWAQIQAAHSDASAVVESFYAPCLDIGPDDPGCILTLSEFERMDGALDKAQDHLDDYRETKNTDGLAIASDLVETLLMETSAIGM